MGRFLYIIFKLILIIVLPFIILIRSSVYIHENYNFGAYPSILGGVIIASILIMVYFTIVYGRIADKVGDLGLLKKKWIVAFLIVLGYSIHGIFFMSPDNFKNSEIKSEITKLHPLLRLGVSTLVMIDKDMLITDASRVVEDYDKMGLNRNSRSLHIPQKDGYAYAVDLRTNGRNEIRNKSTQLFFKLLGFKTLRHVGTSDHLHISLHSHYR